MNNKSLPQSYDVKEFVKIWNSCNHVQEVANKLNISYSTAHSRACHLKQFHNIQLKRFKKVKNNNV